MIFRAFVVASLAASSSAFVPCPRPVQASTTSLSAHQNQQQPEAKAPWWIPTAASFAALTLASQGAMASVNLDVNAAPQASWPESSSTIVTAAQYETLDFSMPSYDDAVKGEKSTNKLASPPSFNPFGDFTPEIVTSPSSSADSKAEERAAAEEKRAELKAAEEKKRAEDRAAAEERKAEAKEAREAEKEARRQEQLAKQKAAADRSRAEEVEEDAAPVVVEEPESKFPSFGDFKAPDFKVPDFKTPDFKVPDFKTPDFKVPDFKTPDFKTPDFASDFKVPDFKTPEFTAPDFKAPEMPKFAMPQIDLPKFDVPKFDVPTSSNDGSFGSLSESQDSRDARAREARLAYLDMDREAQEKEQIAREYRQMASEKLKLARQAKDIACETRPGGKLLCLRNPFTAGF